MSIIRNCLVHSPFMTGFEALDDKRRFGSRPSSSMQYIRDPSTLLAQSAPSTLETHPMPPPNPLSHSEAIEKFNVCYLKKSVDLNTTLTVSQGIVAQLESVLAQTPQISLSALPPNHDIRNLLRRILQIASECADRSQTPLLLSQKLVQHLYKTTSQLGRDVYAALLEQLCRAFDEVAKQAIPWLLFADDDVSVGNKTCVQLFSTLCFSASSIFLL